MTTLAPFQIHRAASVTEASSLIGELGDDAVLYSGGTELLLLMKLGFARYGHLVDIKPIEELGRLQDREGWLHIGATVSHHDVERSPLVRARWPDLAAMECRVANVRVRTTGSLGGNLAFADPHSDPATFLLAADATIHLGRGADRRSLAIDDFILGPYETALQPAELLLAVEVPGLPPEAAMSHLRFAFHERPAATVSAWVWAPGGRIADVRVAVGSVGAQPVRVPGVAEVLAGQVADAIDVDALALLGTAAAAAAEPVGDANGSADYKQALVRALVPRAISEAAGRATSRTETPA